MSAGGVPHVAPAVATTQTSMRLERIGPPTPPSALIRCQPGVENTSAALPSTPEDSAASGALVTTVWTPLAAVVTGATVMPPTGTALGFFSP